jgi:hypothetical protein
VEKKLKTADESDEALYLEYVGEKNIVKIKIAEFQEKYGEFIKATKKGPGKFCDELYRNNVEKKTSELLAMMTNTENTYGSENQNVIHEQDGGF